jgi:ribosomal protein S18 acetylase RimI-like enzyme
MISGLPLFFRQGQGARRWNPLKKRDFPAAEAFLREREKRCVSACARFIHPSKNGRIWFLPDEAGNIASLLLHSGNAFIPVLGEHKDIPAPRFLNFVPLYFVQGLTPDVDIFEDFLAKTGRRSTYRIDYDLMYIDREPQTGVFPTGPAGLVLRTPNMADIEALFPLQAAYEREEVLPLNKDFSPFVCRLALEHIVKKEHVLAACLGGRIVGKVNTNAKSFTCCQIGGVYVHPDYRGQGIATLMTAALVQNLVAQGKGVSLFVKKLNTPARAVYRRIGFKSTGNYRIVYY